MSATRKIFSTSGQLLRGRQLPFKARESARGYHIVAVPPRCKVPVGERYAMGVILGISVLAIPTWVLYHIPDYQNEDRNTYRGR